MNIRGWNVFVGSLIVAEVGWATAPAAAQTAPSPTRASVTASPRSRHHWEFEFHGGGSTAPTLPAGMSQLASITAAGERMKTTSSWFFGFGPEVMSAAFVGHGSTAGLPTLDPLLNTSATSRAALGVGARGSVSMTRHLALEFGLDLLNEGGLSPAAVSRIESIRSDFVNGMTAVLTQPIAGDSLRDYSSTAAASAALPVVVATPAVSATDTIRGAMTVVPYGALRVNAGSIRSFQPYAVIGGGVSVVPGPPASLNLTGEYEGELVLPTGPAPLHDVDAVSVEWRQPAHAVFVLGGGLTRSLTRRTGLRADVRLVSGPSREEVVLTTQPSVTLGTPPAALFIRAPGSAAGVLVLANSAPPPSFSNRTLSAPPILAADGPIFVAKGWQRQVDFTVGYYVRF